MNRYSRQKEAQPFLEVTKWSWSVPMHAHKVEATKTNIRQNRCIFKNVSANNDNILIRIYFQFTLTHISTFQLQF